MGSDMGPGMGSGMGSDMGPGMGSDAESEASKLAAPKLFGRKKTPRTPSPAAAPAEKPPRQPLPRRTPRSRLSLPSLPALPEMAAAAVAGLVVGVFLVLATYGSLELCSTVRGASTCGGKAGFPLLLAIGLMAVVGGGTLLRVLGVTSPMGDSFLAVALVTVVTVLFLGDHYDAWWMSLVVPLLSIAAYVLAHWVGERLIDPVED